MADIWLIIENGAVSNRIVWDGDTDTYQPPSGATWMPDRAGVGIGWRYDAGTDTFTAPPAPEPEPLPLIEITADVLFFERMTDEEYDDLDASVRAGETARVYRGWAAATSFTEGTAMWALLDKHLSLVVTAARKAELLARPAEAAFAPVEDPALAA